MAKKKTRQQDPNDSSDSGDENVGSSAPTSACKHIGKAVHLGNVKKKLKGGVRTSCDTCVKKPKQANIEPDVSLNNGEVIDENWSYWMCLACAHIGCGRSQYKHAMDHWKTPHSESHDMVVDIDSWIVWCYTCEQKMAMNSTKKLQECVEYIRRHMQSSTKHIAVAEGASVFTETEASTVVTAAPALEKDSTGASMNEKPSQSEVKKNISLSKKVAKPSKVRGLMNLGNTCFYNSVLQCLSVTPYLTKVLEKLTCSGENFTLPGEIDADGYEVPAVFGALGESGPLSNALLSMLLEMRNPELHADVLRPQKLLKQVQDAFPQFRGHEQHDAHELLRHLLEGVRSDDLKRFQRVILEKHGLFRRKKDDDVADHLKKRIKLYGQQLQDFILGVEGIFKGQLVSIVECQDCRHHSTRFESFLDLSLPVMEDKPLPPMRKKEQAEHLFGSDNAPSKHQLKKQKKLAKRSHRSQKSRRGEKMDDCLTIVEENAKGSDDPESEQSDADVEDNAEQDQEQGQEAGAALAEAEAEAEAEASCNGREVVESGYSSEKHNTGESDGTSPSIATANGDDAQVDVDVDPASAALASPAVSASLTASASPSPTASASPCVVESPTAPVSSGGPTSPTSPTSAGPMSETAATALSAEWSAFHTPELDCANCEASAEAEAPLTARCFTPVDEELRITIPESGEGSIHISPVLPSDRPTSRRGFFPGDVRPTGTGTGNAMVADLTPELESRLLSLCLNGSREGSQEQVAGPDGSRNDSLDNAIDKVENKRKIEEWCQKQRRKVVEESREQNSLDSDDMLADVEEKSLVECGPIKTPVGVVGEMTTGAEVPSKTGETVDSRNEVSGWCRTLAPRYQTEEGECSVISCLNQFTSVELMTGNNRVGCDACTQRQNKDSEGKTVYTNSTKQLLISSPPPVLILHLKRFMMDNFRFKKLQRFVSFPLDLDIGPFYSMKCKDSASFQEMQTEVRYSLFGIVEHTGSLNTGHYIAYIKIRTSLGETDPRWSFLPKTREFVYPKVDFCANTPSQGNEMEEKWYSISDSRVVEIAEAKVLKIQAYLLFYERIM